MNKKILGFILLLSGVLLFAQIVLAAGDFAVRDIGDGTEYFRITKTSGDVNISVGDLNVSGTIAENGVLLSETYCALAGCTMTGTVETPTIQVNTNLILPDDSIGEKVINFNETTCGSGSRLYISGGNLACEVATAETAGDVTQNITTLNLTVVDIVSNNLTDIYGGILGINDSALTLNLTVVDLLANLSALNKSADGHWQEILTLNSSVEAIDTSNFVLKTGDAMSGALNMTGENFINFDTNVNITKDSTTILATNDNDDVIVWI